MDTQWAVGNDIHFTRGRSCHKNDNWFAEQKNDACVRQYVGYARQQCVMPRLHSTRYAAPAHLFHPSCKTVTGKMFLPKRGKDVFQSNGKDVFL